MEKILILRGGALGDFIVTLPALARLRERWPHSRIELAGNANAAQLAVTRGLLDVAHSQHESRWAGLYGDAPLLGDFAAWLATFDLIISYWPDPDGELVRRFPLHARQRFLTAPALPARSPAAAHYCDPLRELGIRPARDFHPLRPVGEIFRQDRPGPREGERILIHPGSGSSQKNWPAQNWRALIAALSLPVSLILGEAEKTAWKDEIASDQRRGDRPLHRIDAPLEILVTELARCRLFLGHDSGISHLAAASGARCVLLFGPTEPACWAPPAPNVRVLRNGLDLASLSVDAVQAAVAEALADRT